MKAQKAASKPLLFTIGGYPVDKLSQRQMRELKTMADQQGITVEEALEHALRLFAAKFYASLDPGEKVIKFPSGGRRGRTTSKAADVDRSIARNHSAIERS